MRKHYDVAIMMISFFIFFVFVFMSAWAFSEKIGDGSWNGTIFMVSSIGIVVSPVIFVISLIWTFIRGWKKS
ncbi:hypothetical protein [Dyadobacter sp. 50-39]|uniref:hypothetical protein n=1 Tax=Dyadobacter sp. 50-39 TaxID=1895756 RepID=UPI000A92A5AB|nr:hypothetical protein [Dyadobacter sp. 50-39]